MYDYYPLGKIFLETSTNCNCKFPRHFPTEYELFISWTSIYPFVHGWPFYINKIILYRSFTEDLINSK